MAKYAARTLAKPFGACPSLSHWANNASSVSAPSTNRGEGWCTDVGVPFSIAGIYRNKIHIGWGALCGLHVNSPEDKCTCKKTIAVGTGAGRLSDEECIVRLKRWLLAGLLIPKSAKDARKKHLGIDARYKCAKGIHPDSLDATLAERWHAWQCDGVGSAVR